MLPRDKGGVVDADLKVPISAIYISKSEKGRHLTGHCPFYLGIWHEEHTGRGPLDFASPDGRAHAEYVGLASIPRAVLTTVLSCGVRYRRARSAALLFL